ncbi:protection of telomeres protein 1a-like isoform X1 [Musa acuminata AAA Group]|uniref:protection of telomeres protein 1a-like isoform X1 n=2 Tax=Musa acuminata AAA Group TaxID=214697 RepID=UPI0031D93DE1
MEERGPSVDSVYLPIRDARTCIHERVNIFAAVSSIGAEKKSRGTDYVVSLKIMDQSYMEPGISVNFFAEDMTKLPHVRAIGDIISLQNVEVRIHRGDVYCVHNKKFSAFALFQGKTTSGLIHYQKSAKYHATNHDDEFLSQIRTWLLDNPPKAVGKDVPLLLRRIKLDLAFDLVCKVLHVSETSKGDWMLFVWDGTDTPPAKLQFDLELQGERPCSLHVEELPLTIEVLCTFPRVGSVLRVFASKSFKVITHLHGGNQWVKLCNMICGLYDGMWNGMLQPSSEVLLLSDEDSIAREHLKTYDRRLATALENYPMTSFPAPSHITVLDYDYKPYTTLIESLSHPEVTHKCMCIVRVVAAYPWQAKDLRSPVTGHYRVRFTVEDPTARIHAYICGEDGVKFFQGYPTTEVLTSKMDKLLGITDTDGQAGSDDGVRNPPWVWCCLKSYYLDENNPRGSRRYRIFSTTLVG